MRKKRARQDAGRVFVFVAFPHDPVPGHVPGTEPPFRDQAVANISGESAITESAPASTRARIPLACGRNCSA